MLCKTFYAYSITVALTTNPVVPAVWQVTVTVVAFVNVQSGIHFAGLSAVVAFVVYPFGMITDFAVLTDVIVAVLDVTLPRLIETVWTDLTADPPEIALSI